MTHYTCASYAQYFRNLSRYADVQSRVWHAEGRRTHWTQLLLRFPLRFIQGYVLRLGFLDGLAGLQVCVLVAYMSYLKHAYLWQLQNAVIGGSLNLATSEYARPLPVPAVDAVGSNSLVRRRALAEPVAPETAETMARAADERCASCVIAGRPRGCRPMRGGAGETSRFGASAFSVATRRRSSRASRDRRSQLPAVRARQRAAQESAAHVHADRRVRRRRGR